MCFIGKLSFSEEMFIRLGLFTNPETVTEVPMEQVVKRRGSGEQ